MQKTPGYNKRMDAAIPKPARIAACTEEAFTEAACTLAFCMCALVVSPETMIEQHESTFLYQLESHCNVCT